MDLSFFGPKASPENANRSCLINFDDTLTLQATNAPLLTDCSLNLLNYSTDTNQSSQGSPMQSKTRFEHEEFETYEAVIEVVELLIHDVEQEVKGDISNDHSTTLEQDASTLEALHEVPCQDSLVDVMAKEEATEAVSVSPNSSVSFNLTNLNDMTQKNDFEEGEDEDELASPIFAPSSPGYTKPLDIDLNTVRLDGVQLAQMFAQSTQSFDDNFTFNMSLASVGNKQDFDLSIMSMDGMDETQACEKRAMNESILSVDDPSLATDNKKLKHYFTPSKFDVSMTPGKMASFNLSQLIEELEDKENVSPDPVAPESAKTRNSMESSERSVLQEIVLANAEIELNQSASSRKRLDFDALETKLEAFNTFKVNEANTSIQETSKISESEFEEPKVESEKNQVDFTVAPQNELVVSTETPDEREHSTCASQNEQNKSIVVDGEKSTEKFFVSSMETSIVCSEEFSIAERLSPLKSDDAASVTLKDSFVNITQEIEEVAVHVESKESFDVLSSNISIVKDAVEDETCFESNEGFESYLKDSVESSVTSMAVEVDSSDNDSQITFEEEVVNQSLRDTSFMAKEFEQDISILNQTVEDLKYEMTIDGDDRVELLGNKISTLMENLETVKSRFDSNLAADDHDALLQTKRSYEVKILELEENVKLLKETLQQKAEELASKMDITFDTEERNDLIETKLTYESKIVDLEEQVENLEQQLETRPKPEAIEEKDRVIETYATQACQLKLEIDDLKTQIENAEKPLEMTFDLETRKELIETKLTYENKIVELEEQIEQLREEITSKDSEAVLKEAKVNELLETVNSLNVEVSLLKQKLQEQIEHYNEMVVSLQREVDEQQEMKYQLEIRHTSNLQVLKAQHEKVLAEYHELKNENQKNMETVLEIDSQRAQLIRQAEELANELKAEQEARAQSESRISQLKEILAKREEALEEASEKEGDLYSEMNVLRSLSEQYKNELTNLHLEIETSKFETERREKLESVVLELRDEIDLFKKQADDLNVNKIHLEKELNEMTTAKITLENDVAKLALENDLYKKQADDFTASKVDIEKQLEETIMAKATIESDVAKLISEIDMYKKQTDDFSTSKADLEKRLNEMTTAKLTLEDDVAKLTLENVSYKKQVDDFSASKADLEKQLDEMVTVKATLESDVSQLRSEKLADEEKLAELQNELESSNKVLNGQIESLQKQLEDLQSNACHAESDKLRLEASLAQKEDEVKNLKESCESLNTQLTALEAEKAKVVSEYESTQITLLDKIKCQDSVVQEAREAKSRIDAQLETLREQLEESTTKNAQLEHDKANFDAVKASLESKVEKLTIQYQESSDVIVRLEGQNSVLQDKLDENIATVATYKNNIANFESTIERLQANQTEAQQAYQVLSKEKEGLLATLDQKMRMMEKLQVELSEVEQSKKRRESELQADLSQAKANYQLTVEQLKNQLVVKDEEIVELTSQCQRLKQQQDKMIKELNQSISDTRSLTAENEELRTFKKRFGASMDKIDKIVVRIKGLESCKERSDEVIKSNREVANKLSEEIAKVKVKLTSSGKDSIRTEAVLKLLYSLNDRLIKISPEVISLLPKDKIEVQNGPRGRPLVDKNLADKEN